MAKDSSVLLQEAMLMHQRGALHDAATRYSQVLHAEPTNVDVRCFLGMALAQQRRFAEAADHFRTAIRIAPGHAAAHDMLGLALAELGRREEALKSFDRAIRHQPHWPDAYLHRSNLLLALGRPAEAVETYDRALELNPRVFESWCNRGLALDALGRHEEAIASYDHALALRSSSAETHINRGNALAKLRRHDEAIASFDLALAANPGFAEACVNRGNSLRELGRPEDALASYERALAIRDDLAEAQFSRGITLVGLDRFADAIASFDRALAMRLFQTNTVRRARVLCHRAAALNLLSRFDEVFADLEQSVQLAPDDDEVLFMASGIELQHGRWSEGWRKYERRARKGSTPDSKAPAYPRWKGEKLQDEVLVIRCGYGSGDRIQFGCFAAHLAQRGIKVVLWNDAGLNELLGTIPGIEKVVADIAELDSADPIRWVDMMSLPHLLGTTPDTIPQQVPFLAADPARVAAWRERLGRDGFKIGCVWQGNPEHANDKRRSVPLREFEPLIEIPGVRVISLQKGFGSEQLGQVAFGNRIETLGDDFGTGPAFVDIAAVMMGLDLIISCDTAPAHLAGALGRPVFVALPAAPDWRWLRDRDDCPWYPTARLFRQTALGDWPGVFTRIADAVRTLARAD